MVAETKLQDPRRRLFEEKGMTCIQCHVRNYDEGDYLTSVQKPGETADKVSARPIKASFLYHHADSAQRTQRIYSPRRTGTSRQSARRFS